MVVILLLFFIRFYVHHCMFVKIFRILFEERSLSKREAGALHRFMDQIIHGPPRQVNLPEQ